MSIKGFIINGELVLYDYDDLADKPTIPAPITVDSALSGTSENPVQNKVIKVALDQKGSGQGVSDDLKTALLQLAEKVAYIDANGQDYYQDLYDALYATPSATLTSITAVYTQTGVVYDSATLDSLKANLVVTGNYDDGTSQPVIGYTLSGTLTVGTSTITVTYQGKTTTFTVTVTATPTQYNITNTLTSVTNSNAATTIYGGESYSATLTASYSDYIITTVTVTMGGTDITGTAYNSGTISIANVTGNIVITAVATQRVATLSSISAVFTQGTAVIYDTDSLDVLKQYLVVTANWSDSTSSTVASSDYTLSGTLTEGTSTVTVSYGGKTTSFTVAVSTFDTSPAIEEENKMWSASSTPYSISNKSGACITEDYTYTIDVTTLKASSDYDSTNDYMKSNGSIFQLKYLNPNSAGISWSGKGHSVVRGANDDSLTYASTAAKNTETTWQSGRYNSDLLNAGTIKFSWTLTMTDAEYSYAYFVQSNNTHIMPVGVSVGDIMFAGENTPYYGCRNINDAPTMSSISAVFTQGQTVVTPNTSLDTLRDMLAVTASYANGRTHPVNSKVYTLTGTLTEGTSTVTVEYNGKTATFNVVVSAA